MATPEHVRVYGDPLADPPLSDLLELHGEHPDVFKNSHEGTWNPLVMLCPEGGELGALRTLFEAFSNGPGSEYRRIVFQTAPKKDIERLNALLGASAKLDLQVSDFELAKIGSFEVPIFSMTRSESGVDPLVIKPGTGTVKVGRRSDGSCKVAPVYESKVQRCALIDRYGNFYCNATDVARFKRIYSCLYRCATVDGFLSATRDMCCKHRDTFASQLSNVVAATHRTVGDIAKSSLEKSQLLKGLSEVGEESVNGAVDVVIQYLVDVFAFDKEYACVLVRDALDGEHSPYPDTTTLASVKPNPLLIGCAPFVQRINDMIKVVDYMGISPSYSSALRRMASRLDRDSEEARRAARRKLKRVLRELHRA